MPINDSFVVYRIERHAPDVLRLSRNDCLVDQDVEQADDSREDIERWGSGVAWAEDRTSIARWDAQPADGDRWQVLIGAAYRYVQWQFEGARCWDEIDPEGWASRHIEAGPNGRYQAAAALSEVVAARDEGGTEAVDGYERVYGVAPEAAFPPEAEPELTSISGREFVERWNAARHELENICGADRGKGALTGDAALGGVDHEAGGLEDLQECCSNASDRVVVHVEIHPEVARETEGRGGL